MMKRILVPVDFSEFSLKALEGAIELARHFKAELVVVHVLEPVYLAGSGDPFGGGYDARVVYEELERSARQHLARLAAKLATRQIKARTRLAVGTAHQVIVETARKVRADLIVMSTHGRTGLSHLAMGSVAERVVRTAKCPVMTLRAAKRAARRRTRGARPAPPRPRAAVVRRSR